MKMLALTFVLVERRLGLDLVLSVASESAVDSLLEVSEVELTLLQEHRRLRATQELHGCLLSHQNR